MITGKPGAYYVKSKDGSRNLGGPYKSLGQAKRRIAQVEYFKSLKEWAENIRLSINSLRKK